MANTVAIGAVMGILGLPIEPLFDILTITLRKKDEAILEINRNVARAGYEYARSHCTRCAFSLDSPSAAKMLIDGNEAIGFGAVVSGCKFYSAYPMTPSTGIMVSIAEKAQEYGIIVEQAEDEICAINMALGASFGGVRAMTGSSGGSPSGSARVTMSPSDDPVSGSDRHIVPRAFPANCGSAKALICAGVPKLVRTRALPVESMAKPEAAMFAPIIFAVTAAATVAGS